MKRLIIVAALLLPFGAFADNHRSWNPGTFWTVTSVDTKPGKFDAYIEDLKNNWRKAMDAHKANGKVKSYQMFSNVHNRADEGDLYLLVEWNSAADMLDTPPEYFEGVVADVFGSLGDADKANIDRGELRTIMNTSLLREISFAD